jgi:hypothetical protein
MNVVRRPGLAAVAVRWRVELAAGAALGTTWHFAGSTVIAAVIAAAVLVVATVPPVRQFTARGWQLVVLPHRVRAALAEAGAVDRLGRLPWVLWALSAGENVVRVEVKLRAGVAFEDVYFAAPYLRSACASPEVRVLLRPRRPDRVTVLLVRPRWGLLG